MRLFAMGRGPRGKWGPFEWDFGDRPGGRHGGPGRGRRRMFEGGELRLVLSKLIVDEPRHGYDLIRAVEDMTGGQYAPSPGVVYPTLTLLQDMGLIEEAPGKDRASPSRPRPRAATTSPSAKTRSKRCSNALAS